MTGPETPADYAEAMDRVRANIERRMRADEKAPQKAALRPSFEYRGLSNLVRAKIDERGMGYRGAAAEIGVTASDLSRIGGAQGITFEKVVAICDWLGIDPRDLYTGPSASRCAPAAAQPAASAGPSDGLASCTEPMKSTCCSAAHVKQARAADPAEGGKPDRASGRVARPARSAAAEGGDSGRAKD